MSRETTLYPLSIGPGEVVHRNRNVEIRRVVAKFDGFEKEYFVSDYGRRAAVVIMDGGRVLLARQYRLMINEIALEIPGGRAEPEESLEDAAVRECLEETGIRCQDLSPLISYELGLDTVRNPTTVFVASAFEQVGGVAEDRFAWVPFEQCLDMVFSGGIRDSLTVLALLACRARCPAPRGAVS
ncbi:MAG: NUDIX hydrolase [Planctomycetota bacterium]